MCPLATSPCLSTLLVCLSSICCFKGCHVSWRQARYRTTCKVAERKYSTAFDKSEKPFVQEQGVSVQTAMCIPKSKLLCDLFPPISATFRDFPRLSATFRDFPPLFAIFRHFPPLSAPFAGAVEKIRQFSAQFPQIFRNFPQILEVQCALHGRGRTAQWSLWCTVEAHQVKGVVVVLTSGQWRVFHSNKSDCSCNVNRKLQCMATIK